MGVFDNADALDAAVDELEMMGFNRAIFSVLASDKTVEDRLRRLYRSVVEIEDDPRALLAAFVSKDPRVEGEAATVGVPLFIGGIAGGLAVVASGGTFAAALDAAIPVCAAICFSEASRSGLDQEPPSPRGKARSSDAGLVGMCIIRRGFGSASRCFWLRS